MNIFVFVSFRAVPNSFRPEAEKEVIVSGKAVVITTKGGGK